MIFVVLAIFFFFFFFWGGILDEVTTNILLSHLAAYTMINVWTTLQMLQFGYNEMYSIIWFFLCLIVTCFLSFDWICKKRNNIINTCIKYFLYKFIGGDNAVIVLVNLLFTFLFLSHALYFSLAAMYYPSVYKKEYSLLAFIPFFCC